MGVQGLDPQRVRKIGLEFRRAPAEHRVPIRDRTRHQVREQPRLADPRLALDRHHRARAPGRPSSAAAIASRSRARPTNTDGDRCTRRVCRIPDAGAAGRLGTYTDAAALDREDTACMQTEAIHPAVRIGHVHLCVADLDRSLVVLPRRARLRRERRRAPRRAGDGAAGRRRLSPSHRPEHVRQRRCHAAPVRPHRPLPRRLPLPDRRELGRAVCRLLDHDHPIDHATDHGGTVSVYLADPDGNGIELYYDRPRADWSTPSGRPRAQGRALRLPRPAAVAPDEPAAARARGRPGSPAR